MIRTTTIFIFLVIVAFVNTVSAQQSLEPSQYSMYMLNKYQFNPGYSGLDESLSFTGVYRQQWVGLEGKPESQNFNFHLPLYYLHGGLGFQFENETIGVEQNSAVSIGYSYHKKFKRNGILTLGLEGGLAQKSLDGTLLRAPDGEYSPDSPNTHNDIYLPEGKESAMAPLLNFGIYFKSETFEVGLAASNLLASGFKFNYGEQPTIKGQRDYFLNFAYTWEVSSMFKLQPSLMVKSDAIEYQTEISTILTYNDNIFGGASFRGYGNNSIDAIIFLAGVKLSDNLTLAYSYDLTMSTFNLASRGSHEIFFNYNLNKDIGKGVPAKIIYSPRFL